MSRTDWKVLIGTVAAIILIFTIAIIANGSDDMRPPAFKTPVYLTGHGICYRNEPDRWWVVWHAYPRHGDEEGVVTYSAGSGAEDWTGWQNLYAQGTYSREEREVSMEVKVTFHDEYTYSSNRATVVIPDGC